MKLPRGLLLLLKKNHHSWQCSSNAAKEAVGLFSCTDTSLVHGQLAVHQVPRVLFCQAAFQSAHSQHDVIPTQLDNFASAFVKHH